jgi:hypothetical protein
VVPARIGRRESTGMKQNEAAKRRGGRLLGRPGVMSVWDLNQWLTTLTNLIVQRGDVVD